MFVAQTVHACAFRDSIFRVVQLTLYGEAEWTLWAFCMISTLGSAPHKVQALNSKIISRLHEFNL